MSAIGPHLLFRSDASIRIGTGHVRRCLALADAARALGGHATFVTRDLGLATADWIRKAGHEAIELPRPPSGFAPPSDAPPHAAWAEIDQLEDARQTIAAACGENWAGVVVDSYAFDAAWHRAVSQAFDAPLMAIDDVADRPLATRFVVDHNWIADPNAKYRAALDAGATLLAGPRFSLIDPVYVSAARYRFAEKVTSIGIFMGGVDSHGLSLPIARALRSGGFDGAIEIATTSANPQLDELTAAARAEGLSLLVDRPNLASFFARHDLQIGAGGGATWERCCIGAPTLAVATAENQHEALDPLASIDVIAVPPAADPAAIAGAALALVAMPERRAALSRAARALVDGHGAERVILALLAGLVEMRAATLADGKLMHGWRDDPAVRSVSRHPEPIELDRHLAWLEASLAMRSRTILIAQIGTRPVGVVRFDLRGAEAEISIYLDPLLSGLGLGTRVLAAAERAYTSELESQVTLIAETLPGNEASRRLFQAAHYDRAGDLFRKRIVSSGKRDQCSR